MRQDRAVGDARQSTVESRVMTERSLMRFVCVGVFFCFMGGSFDHTLCLKKRAVEFLQ